MNDIERILNLFNVKPYLVKMGAGKISKSYKVSVDDILEARKILYKTKERKKEVKILIFDIETSPMKAYVWRRWKQNIYLE